MIVKFINVHQVGKIECSNKMAYFKTNTVLLTSTF